MFKSAKEGSKKLTLSPVKSFVQTVFIPVCVFIISLGSFSEAFILMGDFKNVLKSTFSNDFEYETLGAIHVGNTEAYVEDLVGAPAATKKLSDSLQANYYLDGKYLLTAYVNDGRVEAYTVVSNVEGFSPLLPWHENKELLSGSFSTLGDAPQSFAFDHANTNSFFIELSVSELSGLFQNAYLGAVQYGVSSVGQERLAELYNAEVYGTEDETLEKINEFREGVIPNLYGQGELEIELIQKGLLSNGEFLKFFSGED